MKTHDLTVFQVWISNKTFFYSCGYKVSFSLRTPITEKKGFYLKIEKNREEVDSQVI